MLSGVPAPGASGAGGSYDVDAMGRYKGLDGFVRAHPGQVKNFTGHSKGAAVVDKWMKTTQISRERLVCAQHLTRISLAQRDGKIGLSRQGGTEMIITKVSSRVPTG